MYGSVRTVVWQGSAGDRCPYADQQPIPYVIQTGGPQSGLHTTWRCSAGNLCGMIALLGERFTMMYGAGKALAGILAVFAFSSGALSHALCSVDVVIVNGRVEHAPRNASVRVQLVYPKQKKGELGETTLEGGSFLMQIPFLTQSHAPMLMGNLLEKCDRKPETVVVTWWKLIRSMITFLWIWPGTSNWPIPALTPRAPRLCYTVRLVLP